jgi:hypothetical protein
MAIVNPALRIAHSIVVRQNNPIAMEPFGQSNR